MSRELRQDLLDKSMCVLLVPPSALSFVKHHQVVLTSHPDLIRLVDFTDDELKEAGFMGDGTLAHYCHAPDILLPSFPSTSLGVPDSVTTLLYEIRGEFPPSPSVSPFSQNS